MLNTLYLPELRELLAENNDAELAEFCVALHPARTAEFMEGLTATEAWLVLLRADIVHRSEIFSYFDHDKQIQIAESQQRKEIASLIAEMPPDDRVDLIREMASDVVTELLPLLPAEERRDILRLRAYPERSAGALMTTEFAKLGEQLTVHEALEELGRQAEQLETINYLYVVDAGQDDQLRGVLSARQLLSAIARPHTHLADLMERDLVTTNVLEDQEEIANKVAHFDLMAIPVIDDTHRMLGIITHDDVIDVMREEATEDAHRIAAVEPLTESYLNTDLLTLTWKRGIWLTVLFLAALMTAVALDYYEDHQLRSWPWLVAFIPLVVSSGGNTGNQTATLVITGMATGDVAVTDWLKVLRRELIVGLLLGVALALIGFIVACVMRDANYIEALVLPCTLLLVVLCGAVVGAVFPLLFQRLDWDPALMSSPFIAGIIDIVGIVIYMGVAAMVLSWTTPASG